MLCAGGQTDFIISEIYKKKSFISENDQRDVVICGDQTDFVISKQIRQTSLYVKIKQTLL